MYKFKIYQIMYTDLNAKYSQNQINVIKYIKKFKIILEEKHE